MGLPRSARSVRVRCSMSGCAVANAMLASICVRRVSEEVVCGFGWVGGEPVGLAVDHPFDEGEEEAFFASEVVVQLSFAHVGGGQDAIDRGVVVAPLAELGDRGLEELVAVFECCSECHGPLFGGWPGSRSQSVITRQASSRLPIWQCWSACSDLVNVRTDVERAEIRPRELVRGSMRVAGRRRARRTTRARLG